MLFEEMLFFFEWAHEPDKSLRSKGTFDHTLQTVLVFKVTHASQCEESVLLQDRPSSLASCIKSTDEGPKSRVWDAGAVCRLSTYARRSKGRVKYQEHLKQIVGLAVMGARAGKCTL